MITDEDIDIDEIWDSVEALYHKNGGTERRLEDESANEKVLAGIRWALSQCQALEWKRPEEFPDDKRISVKTPIIMLFLILGHLEWTLSTAENLLEFDMQVDMDDDKRFVAWAYWCGPSWVEGGK